MKLRPWLYIPCFVALAALASAEQPWPTVVRDLTDSDFKPVLAANRPEGIALYAKDDQTKAQRDQRIIYIASVHLSKSNDNELIVEADEGGSAGTYHDIYQKRNGVYVNIGSLGACFGIKVLTPFRGYSQIEAWERFGGGIYFRNLYRFVHGEYSCIRSDQFPDYEGDSTDAKKTDE
jgi:hypothetical protein